MYACTTYKVAQKKPCVRLANKKKRSRWAKQPLDRGTLPRRAASQSRLFTVDVETGVCGYYLMKLPVEDL